MSNIAEIDVQETVNRQVNDQVFEPASGWMSEVKGLATLDENGVFRTALGDKSSAAHRHVALSWQEQCVPFEDFHTYQQKLAKGKYDKIVPESEVRLNDDLTLLSDGTPLNRHGMTSLREFTGIPSHMERFFLARGWYDSSLSDEARKDYVKWVNRALDDREVSWAMKNKDPRKFKLRYRDGLPETVVRAVLSQDYAPFDNLQVMEAVKASLPGGSKGALCSYLFDDGDKVSGSVLLPDNMKAEPDSDWGVGFLFGNSEVGDGIYFLIPYLFRALCFNGIRAGQRMSKSVIQVIHRGKMDVDKIRADTKRAITVALSQGNDLLTLMGYARDIPVSNMPGMIVAAGGELGLTSADMVGWAKGYRDSQEEPFVDGTLFGLVQGLTRYARDVKDEDLRARLETSASLVLSTKLIPAKELVENRAAWFSQRASMLEEDDAKLQYVKELLGQPVLSGQL